MLASIFPDFFCICAYLHANCVGKSLGCSIPFDFTGITLYSINLVFRISLVHVAKLQAGSIVSLIILQIGQNGIIGEKNCLRFSRPKTFLVYLPSNLRNEARFRVLISKCSMMNKMQFDLRIYSSEVNLMTIYFVYCINMRITRELSTVIQ